MSVRDLSAELKVFSWAFVRPEVAGADVALFLTTLACSTCFPLLVELFSFLLFLLITSLVDFLLGFGGGGGGVTGREPLLDDGDEAGAADEEEDEDDEEDEDLLGNLFLFLLDVPLVDSADLTVVSVDAIFFDRAFSISLSTFPSRAASSVSGMKS